MRPVPHHPCTVNRSAGVLTLAGFLLAGLVATPVHATDLSQAFSFGPNPVLPQFSTSSASRTLNVPGHSVVSVSGTLNPLQVTGLAICNPTCPGGQLCAGVVCVPSVPVLIEVFKPEGGTAAATISTQALPFVSIPFAFLLPPTFISDFGCPRTWRVRVRTANGTVPSAVVSGNIVYSFVAPGGGFPNPLPATYNVDMEGSSLHLEGGGAQAIPILAGHDPVLLGLANRSLIEGTEGTFRIKAKWDTAFHVCYLNRFFSLNVALLRPNGTLAASETAFSQIQNPLATAQSNKVDFSYVAVPNDAMMAGRWRLRVTNNNSVPCGFGTTPVAVDSFDVENLLPGFQSTFTPRCSGNVGSAEGIPSEADASVGARIDYGVEWTVPDPEDWHSLNTFDVRLVDPDGEIALELRFDEATGTISQVNTANGRLLKSDLPGSKVRFEGPDVTLFLEDSAVIGSGPTGPSVLLKLSLSFKARTSMDTFTVEARATDDAGSAQGWDLAGAITVLPR